MNFISKFINNSGAAHNSDSTYSPSRTVLKLKSSIAFGAWNYNVINSILEISLTSEWEISNCGSCSHQRRVEVNYLINYIGFLDIRKE